MTSTPNPPQPDLYHVTASAFLALLGGRRNIRTLTNCVTRIRVTLNEPDALHRAELCDHPAVLGLLERDTLHIIVGPAAVTPLTAALRTLLQQP
ncbi:PTS transporter subunit EIIB [Streptomyces sp. SGAir0957]